MASVPVDARTARPEPLPSGGAGALAQAERDLLAQVEPSLTDGLALLAWFREVDARNSYAKRFEVVSEFNRPDSSYGFFDDAPVGGRSLPVMGVVQEQLYDHPKSPKGYTTIAADWMNGQVREFILRYFLRVSAFRQPEAAFDSGRKPPEGLLGNLSWCPSSEDTRAGFGYEQVYYQRLDGTTGKFADDERFKILDLREVARSYRWIVLKVRVFDFKFNFKLRRPGSPEVVIPLAEESYLVLSPEWISADEKPEPGVLGRFGFGYAFLRDPASAGLLAYGPGQFKAAFQTIQFKVLDSGEIRVCMVFVVNRPERILNVSVNPFDWTLRLADWMSLGMSSRLLAPMQGTLDRLRGGGIDPVFGSISLAGTLSGGLTERDLCISRDQLQRTFLVRHFLQHYQTIVGSLLTWRSIADWCDEAALPEWVRRGGDT